MTPEMALTLGRAIAHVFKGANPNSRIVIGKDTRLSNYMFETALQAGICSMGVDAVQLGVLPTPAIAFMTTGMRADAGVVISASHNPYDDNGLKFFAADGFKLADSFELQLEGLIETGDLQSRGVKGAEVGRAYRVEDAVGRYCVFLKQTFPRHLSLSGLRIVVDCAHGAGYRVAPEVLYELGAEVITAGASPNGTNINDGVGALYPQNMADLVVRREAHMGIALDGDADRTILCDERGNIVDGDAILAVLGIHMHARGSLHGDTVVATTMSNLGLERALTRYGIGLERTAVGDRYVVERMKSGGFNLGGEQSGHILNLDHSTTGDGLLTALQILAIMVQEQRPLSEISSIIDRVPQVLDSFEVASKPPLSSLPGVVQAMDDVRGQLASRGRVVVRYSGTERKCRVMVEGDDDTEIQQACTTIRAAIEAEIGLT